MDLKRGIDKAVDTIIKDINKQAQHGTTYAIAYKIESLSLLQKYETGTCTLKQEIGNPLSASTYEEKEETCLLLEFVAIGSNENIKTRSSCPRVD